MTQVHFDAINLPRLVRASHGIFVVRPDDPPARLEPIPILPAGSAYAGRNDPPYYEPPYHDPDPGPHLDKNYPPYGRRWHRFRVLERLKLAAGAVAADGVEICEADTGRQEELHRMYYLDGRRKSPIYESYQPSRAVGETEDRIVFARQREGRWHLAVAWAFESLAARAAVERAIADDRPADDTGDTPT